jgi:hypothetical protein
MLRTGPDTLQATDLSSRTSHLSAASFLIGTGAANSLSWNPRPCATIATPDEGPGSSSFVLIGQKRGEIVEKLVASAIDWLENKYGQRDEVVDGGESTCYRSQKVANLSEGSQQRRGFKKQTHDRDGYDSSNNEDVSDGADRDKKRLKTHYKGCRPKFACPYFKRDPIRFKNERTCCGPGWDEVHRVKYLPKV